ncbi:baseplate J/gp47 family protein [Candidatus Tokpelaia sp.]|uniref:baseplate J/gp47 family protein n=1 Tax=Candidatus Tokpelaia sp. TaxID=2233777 RepID=UPI00123B0CBE|nr:baseplate J/gp47 family protein [Candidatus Tokpelaia sp.]KAA6404502.1 hypothetical protein DPQ22_09735 [Candidatus Tokpelaia sp.]
MRKNELGAFNLDTLRALPRPNIYERDPLKIKARMIAYFEQQTGRKLYDGQVEMYLIETWAYGFSLAMEEAQAQAEQYLVAFSAGGGLDALGANRSLTRLPSAAARTTLRFALLQPQARPLTIPADFAVRSEDSDVQFLTLQALVIAAGQQQAEVQAVAAQAGAAGNGFATGSLTIMTSPIAGLAVANITVSSGGADIESDDAYRLRLANALELVSQSGPAAGYRERIFAVSAAIVDCAVFRPQPCYIDIYALTATGTAGTELKAQIEAALDPEYGRPMGDEVTIKDCEGVELAGTLTIRAYSGLPEIEKQAQAQLSVITDGWRQSLAAVIAPSDLIEAVKHIGGVLDAQIDGLIYQKLTAPQYVAKADITIKMEMVNG